MSMQLNARKMPPFLPCSSRRFTIQALAVLALSFFTFSPTPARAFDLTAQVQVSCSGAEADEPTGFGTAGWLPEAHMDTLNWVYSWDYNRVASLDHPDYLPMVWGGPTGDENSCTKKYGSTWLKGCANRDGGGCSPAEIDEFVSGIATFVRSHPKACSRTWLIFNEPDLKGPEVGCPESADLDPREAAKIFAAIATYFKEEHQELGVTMAAVDPGAKFYCCGTLGTPSSVAWMQTFLAELDGLLAAKPWADSALDGFHMHNYALDIDPGDVQSSISGKIDHMERFGDQVARPYSQSQNRDLMPVLITESSNWEWPAGYRVQHGQVMEGMAEWLNSCGPSYGYTGAAWYATRTDEFAPCQGVDPDSLVCDDEGNCEYETCAFKTRSILKLGDGRWIESITGKASTSSERYFNFDFSDPGDIFQWRRSSTPLSSAPQFRAAGGPCHGLGAGTPCELNTRTLFYDASGNLNESVTVRGRSYNFVYDADGAATPDSSNGCPLAIHP
ncbi:MAG: glycosyl hydrolase, partial [Acidobacteriota bacterium]